ncbi:MAG: Crp/Fnr family transcriptional regulator [Myxococcaceae bacterium]|nr:Crp/Fnr family transcriptional regulator [Myxococcaceae bacterium]
MQTQNHSLPTNAPNAPAMPKNLIAQFNPDALLGTARQIPIGDDIIDFRGYFNVENYAANQFIYRSNDASGKLYLLQRGRVRLMRDFSDGYQAVIGFLRAGDLFGELSLDEALLTEETALCATACEVWVMTGGALRSLMETRPSLAIDLLRIQSERLRKARRRINRITFSDVPARLAATLLELGSDLGEPCAHRGQTDLRGVTQQDLADLCGASRSFVSTLINEMKRDGYLGHVGRTLCLRDLDGLRAIAGEAAMG